MKPVYGVICAGGNGSRLWPLSRTHCPKPYIPFEGEETLLDKACKRLLRFIPASHVVLVVRAEHAELAERYRKKYSITLLFEPYARNTAAALTYAALTIAAKEPQAVLCSIPADHVIDPEELFVAALQRIVLYAHTHSQLVLVGVTPRRPASEYGYMYTGPTAQEIAPVISFIEKPTIAVAHELYAKKGMYWNAGVVCAQAQLVVAEATRFAPQLVATLEDYIHTKKSVLYEALPALAFDRVVLEKSDRCVVLPVDCGWEDVGTLGAFIAATKSPGKVVSYNAQNVQVYAPGKTVILKDVSNIMVVETADVLYITQKTSESSQDITAYLQQQELNDYL